MGALGEQVIQEEFINLPSKDISFKVVQPENNLFLCRERAQGLSIHDTWVAYQPSANRTLGCRARRLPTVFYGKMVINFFIHNWTVKS